MYIPLIFLINTLVIGIHLKFKIWYMFAGCTYFNQNINTKIVTNNTGTYVAWNTSNVVNMDAMFYQTTVLTQTLIGNWNTSKVQNMSLMFENTYEFNQSINTQVVNVGNNYVAWDVSTVIDFSYMFSNSRFNQPISNWNVSSAQYMIGMFQL